jgi:hypothetical protein
MAVSLILTVTIIPNVIVIIEINCRKSFADCLVVRTIEPLKSLLTKFSSPTSDASLSDKEERIAGTPPAAMTTSYSFVTLDANVKQNQAER